MCEEWRDNFDAFLRDMGRRPPGKSLGRIDVNKGYSKDNCRWETASEQARSRTNNVWVRYDGRAIILKDFAAAMGVSYKALHRRMKRLGEDAGLAAARILAARPN